MSQLSTAAASPATVTPSSGAPTRRLGLALAVIATAQLMVVLDATIVNVALPHIQNALDFSASNLEWVVNAYTLAFGGLLLLGGRSGDLLGRRRIFIAGILLFTLASLLGGFATDQAWLLAARVHPGRRRGDGRAHRPVADRGHLPRGTAAEPGDGRVRGDERGRRRGRADRRRPAGQLPQLALGDVRQRADRAASSRPWPRGCCRESERRTGRFDLPGAITGSLGIASLVYGLSNAATSASGVSHWGDTKVIVSLVGGRGAARGVRVHRGAQQARAAPDAGAAQPGPDRRLPDQPVRRHRAVRHVLLPHDLRAGRVGVQPAEGGRGLPADGRHDHGGLRDRVAAGRPDRRPAADDRRRARSWPAG